MSTGFSGKREGEIKKEKIYIYGYWVCSPFDERTEF